MANAMIMVDGAVMPCPYKFTWNLQRVSDADAGRTQDALMHVNQVAQKRKLEIAWHFKRWEDVAPIMQAFNPEYVSVRYPDMLSGTYETRVFYTGDQKVSTKFWWNAPYENHLLEEISFNLIER